MMAFIKVLNKICVKSCLSWMMASFLKRQQTLCKYLSFRLNGNGYRKSVETILWIEKIIVEIFKRLWHKRRVRWKVKKKKMNERQNKKSPLPETRKQLFASITIYLGHFYVMYKNRNFTFFNCKRITSRKLMKMCKIYHIEWHFYRFQFAVS